MNALVLVFFFFIAASFHQALYLVIPALSIYHLTDRRKISLKLNPIQKVYFQIAVGVFLILTIQALMRFELKMVYIKGLARYITYFLFVSMIFSFEARDLKRLFKIVIIYFALTLPLGIYQVLTIDRYQNVFMHSNHLAYVLTICMYFLVFYKPYAKWTNLMYLFILFVSLVLTKSSGGMLVFLTLLGYNVFWSKQISLQKKMGLLFALLLTLFLTVAFSEKVATQIETFSYLSWDFIKERADEFKLGGYGSLMWRLIYWVKILTTFFAENTGVVLFGMGVDTLTKGNMPYDFMYTDPHNDFLKVLVEFGVMGFAIFLLLLGKVYRVTNKNFNILILLAIPMFFGNVIVNFPFNLSLAMIIVYEYKRNMA